MALEKKFTPYGRLLGGVALSAMLIGGISTVTAAQESAQAEDELEIEEVVVTGSRIQRDPNLTQSAPVSSIDADQIQLSGEVNVAEVLREVPALLTSVSAESSVDSVFATSVGQSVLQLRGLGAERTLVLVNGRRHVSGVAGSQSVDVGSIPPALIERVEVLTGGASSVYGADAVSGVVNFILRDDFEGLEFNAQTGLSPDEGDGETFSVSGTYGLNFDDNRGNVAVSASFQQNDQITFGDRDFSRNNGIADDLTNPAIIAGTAPDGAPTRVIRSQPTFSISSHLSQIAPGDFDDRGTDLNGNGVPDCQESTVGQNATAFGVGGCWVIDPSTGQVRPFQDGAVAGFANQFGGDGVPNNFDEDFLIPDNQRFDINLLAKYELTDNMTAFFEGKFVKQRTLFGGPLNTFYDLLTIYSDNPFIPADLQELADTSELIFSPPAGDVSTGLYMNRDPADLGPNINKNTRETYRFVGGIEGALDNGWTYEVSANYGRFERTLQDRNRVIMDRYFAAIDTTVDENGDPICRSALDGSGAPTTPFDIPLFDFGFFTFNPDDGSCVPLNPFGRGAPSQEAIDFVTTTVENNFTLEQTVFSAFLSGNTEDFFNLPGGAPAFVVGAEYRDEKSTSRFDPLVRGECSVDTPDCSAGQFVGDVTDADGERVFRQNSLVFDPAALVQNAGGGFDVWEIYGEVSLPIAADMALIEELRVDASARYSDYSTVGGTFTWNVGGVYSPIQDIRFRATYAEAVRAPNVSELFDPAQGAFFRPIDPCDQAEIDALLSAGDARGPVREANCRADGIPEGYIDPLTARFVGETSGNPNLEEETGKTLTIGAVFEPRYVPGLSVTVDWFDIEIEDAIAAVSAQDIVDNCYDSQAFPDNQFCGLFSRNRNASSPTFLGFNFLRQTELNFARLETSGWDFAATYQFDIGLNAFTLRANATYIEKLNDFFDPADPEAVDPELGEIQRPEWAGSFNATWQRGDFQLNWNTTYFGKQGLRGVEIETAEQIFGPAGIAGDLYLHDLSGRYQLNENISFYGGINNLTNEKPFITEQAYPVSPRGRYVFLGINARY